MFVNICNVWNGQCQVCPFAAECAEDRDNMVELGTLRAEIEEKIKNLQIMLDSLEFM